MTNYTEKVNELNTAKVSTSVKLKAPILNKRNKKQYENIKFQLSYRQGAEYRVYNGNLHVITFTGSVRQSDRPMMIWFWDNSGKVAGHFYYMTEEKRADRLKELKAASMRRVEQDEKRAIAKANKKIIAKAEAAAVEVGDIFVNSWGYEQTNVDFFQVIERPSAMFAIVREIGHITIKGSEGHDCCNVKPAKDQFIGEPKRVKLNGSGFRVNSYSWASHTTEDSSHYKSWYY